MLPQHVYAACGSIWISLRLFLSEPPASLDDVGPLRPAELLPDLSAVDHVGYVFTAHAVERSRFASADFGAAIRLSVRGIIVCEAINCVG